MFYTDSILNDNQFSNVKIIDRTWTGYKHYTGATSASYFFIIAMINKGLYFINADETLTNSTTKSLGVGRDDNIAPGKYQYENNRRIQLVDKWKNRELSGIVLE